jgi:hypothetical protein
MIALQVAQTVLEQAKQNFQYAWERLTKAEFHLGRTRYMIKKGGFFNTLEQKCYNFGLFELIWV